MIGVAFNDAHLEDLEHQKIREAQSVRMEQIAKENPDSVMNFSESEWTIFKYEYAKNLVEKWRLERVNTPPSLQVPLKEFVKAKKHDLYWTMVNNRREFDKIDNPTLKDYENELIAKNAMDSLYYIKNDLTLG